MKAILVMILNQFISGWELVNVVVDWAFNNKIAAAFWGTVWYYLLDRFFKWTKNTTDDALWDAVRTAVVSGVNRVKELSSLPK